MFLHPVPTREQLPDQGEWWLAKWTKVRRNRQYKLIRQKILRLILGGARYRLVKDTLKAVHSGRYLEVGCGDGKLLAQAAPFYECVGVEPSPIAAAVTRKMGYPVIEFCRWWWNGFGSD